GRVAPRIADAPATPRRCSPVAATMSQMTVHLPAADPSRPLAVLVSGGLDSAVLLAESLHRHPPVWPLYISFGPLWEKVELHHLRRFLDAVRAPALRSLTILEMPVADLYGEHWSLTGVSVPEAGTPDDAVFLPGRNVLFLAKAMLWCHLHGVPALALAPLESNPFPDATPAFFTAYEAIVNRAIGGGVPGAPPHRRPAQGAGIDPCPHPAPPRAL